MMWLRVLILGVCVPVVAQAVECAPLTSRFVVKAPQEATLSSQMVGRLERFYVRDGESFKRGERLAAFDCTERQAQLGKAQAVMMKAEKIEQSQKQLRNLKAISDLEHEGALADLKVAQGDVAMAEAQVRQCYVEAPYAGRVVRRVANQFEHLGLGVPLVQVVESGALRLELLLPSQWLRWLKPGTTFSIQVDELGRSFAAEVTGLGARIDAASQTVNVWATITDPVPELLPGMSGTANFGVR